MPIDESLPTDASTAAAIERAIPAGRSPLGPALPRVLVIIVGVAAAVVVVAGMRAIPQIIGPVFLAVVLTIIVDPLRSWMIRRGAPRWVATLVALLGVIAIVTGLLVAAVLGLAQLATLIPQYADQIQDTLTGVKSWLAGMGVNQADIDNMFSSVDKTNLAALAAGVLGSIGNLLSSVLFVIVLLIFLAVDAAIFGDRMVSRRPGRGPILHGLGVFAAGTRKYFGVATIFGGIVAILDGAALVILGIPAAGLWALLAFVTNYVPNVGFLIGMIPPAILGLLVGGPTLMITVIVVYCVLNFIIQSVLQPKFVGDAVGLTTTMSFLSLVVWAYILGPIGAVLAIPASLLVKAILVDIDPAAKWLQLFLGDEPVFPNKKRQPSTTTPANAPTTPTNMTPT